MNILGLNILNHDTSATLMNNSKVIGMVEEERFTRNKHEKKFPINSIEYLLKKGKLSIGDIDIITVPYNPGLGLFYLFKYCLTNITKFSLFFIRHLYKEMTFKNKIKKIIDSEFKKKNLILNKKYKIFFFEHHLCHAASAYFASPFDESAIISWDGRGQWDWFLGGLGKNGKIKIIKKEYLPNSLGQLYESFTHLLGFTDWGDEYKLMGLSAYGKNKYSTLLNDIVSFQNSAVKINLSKWKLIPTESSKENLYKISSEEISKFRRKKHELISQKHMDLACSLQTKINDIALEIAKNLFTLTKTKNLCITGGIAQNILINQNIYRITGFKNIFVQPASHDGGLSLGGALLARNLRKNKKFIMKHTYWGPDYSRKEIKKELIIQKIKFKKIKNVTKTTAEIISKGKIVGWFQGRSEFGPRSLGNRCILADARKKEMKNKVNKIIKFRESFRPFAPSVIEEDFKTYFENAPENQFMTFSANVKKDKRNIVPAITHIDGTARPQIVYKENAKKFWKLIKEFKKLTGVGLLLNTSFNVKGEPIVNSPKDAINCFLSSGLDYLILDDFLIAK